MRILFLNYEYPPLGGGAANATKYLLAEYVKQGDICVDLVTSATDNIFQIEALSENVRVHYLPIGDKRDSLHYQSVTNLLWYSWKSFWYGAKLLRQTQYDVIHAFFGIPCGAVAFWLRFFFKVPYIISLRGSDVPGYSNRFRVLYPLLRPMIWVVWSGAARVVANSSGLKELAKQTSKSQEIVVIPNGVDTTRFFPDVSERPEGKIVVTVGATRITERKGINFLIEALALLKEKFPSVHLEIMGDGSAKSDLEKLVIEKELTEKVKFLGRIEAEKTYSFYQRASIFVLPSMNEGMSNALLEALASGLPAIVTDTGGSHELVADGENGIYIKKESKESIASALTLLVEDKNTREAYGVVSRQKAETLSWESIALQYQNLYKKVL